jgi:TolA-binding protein
MRTVKNKLIPALSSFLFIFIIFSSCSEEKSSAGESGTNQDSSARLNKNFFSDCDKLLAEAKKNDSILLQQTEVEQNSANAAIKAFADYANYCHNDSVSPVYLIKCAQVARVVNNIPQAKIVLEKCVQDYPRFRDRPAALFLLAQLYDENTYLNNESEAKKLYEEIIEEYPTSDWALSAKGALGFLGKTDEQIMEELKKGKRKKQD